jgi:uncharacterized membrane protein YdjX (TVP38/TMEM64 family)
VATRKTNFWIRVFLLVVLAGCAAFLVYETGLVQFFLSKKRLLSFLQSLGPWSFVGFILLQAGQVLAAPVPGELTGFLGGYLFGTFFGVLLSTIGLTLGSYIAFILARIFGKPLLEKLVPVSTTDRFKYLFRHKGAFLIFLLFLIPGFPKDWLCYVLGLGPLSTMEFLLIGGTGRFFGTLLLTLGGTYVRHHQYGRFYILVGAGIIIAIVVLAYKDKLDRLFRFWHLKSLRKRRRQEFSLPPNGK